MLGSLPVSGASIYCQQVDGLSLDCTTSASVAALDTPPASPRLFGSTALPQTPPSQLLRAASSPPPMRRLQKFASPPPASHPILSSAITVACTADPDACHSQGRLPTQRQLAFSFQNTPPAQQTSPFATAAAIPEPPSLLDKINRLPGPQHVLRTVRKETKDSLSLQDSGMLTHMLHRASRFHTENDGCAGGSSSAGSGCSLPDAPGDAASNLRANGCRACPPPQKAPAPCESSYPMAPANVNTYLTSSRTAFSKSAVKSKRYVAKSQGTACETPAPSPQDRVHLQHAATTLLLPQLDVFFNNAAGRLDSAPLAPACPATPSAMALAYTTPKPHPLPSPGRSTKLFCRSDCSDCRNRGGKTDVIDQAGMADQYSPVDHVSWALKRFSDSADYTHTHSVSQPGHILNAALTGAFPGALPSGPSSCTCWAGGDILTVSTDTRSAHMHGTDFEKLRPPYNAFSSLSKASDKGRASLHEAPKPDTRATDKGLPGRFLSNGTSGCRPVTGGLKPQVGLECRLQLPHGTRSNKRPRLEDKLKEHRMLRADFGHRPSPSGIH